MYLGDGHIARCRKAVYRLDIFCDLAMPQYVYLRFFFSNYSEGIRSLFCDACDLLGIRWRRMNAWVVSIDHQSDIAFLDSFVGPKR